MTGVGEVVVRMHSEMPRMEKGNPYVPMGVSSSGALRQRVIVAHEGGNITRNDNQMVEKWRGRQTNKGRTTIDICGGGRVEGVSSERAI